MKTKKIIIALSMMAMAMAPIVAVANDEGDTVPQRIRGTWVVSTTPSLVFTEKLYNNWSAAGNSLISSAFNFDGSYKYTYGSHIVDNIVKLGLGFDMQDLDDNRSLESFRKSSDVIDLSSTYSHKIYDKFNVNAAVNFKTQFIDGWNYAGAGNDDENRTLVSRFMAPGYLITSIGNEYKADYWNVSVSFLSGKTTFVYSQDVIDAGQRYGVDTTDGNRAYFALGTYIKFYFKKDIAKNLNLYAKMELFYDYNKPKHVDWTQWGDPSPYDTYIKQLGKALIHETDVNFELTANYNLTNYCAVTASLNMKYDTDYAGIGSYGHWQLYQTAGLRVFMNFPRKN
ncbi:MAG: DUF3078 domain-containing protein [Bacteroidales bacterium]|nr:DUF3078 domain-containing protein [Bacteroidales bacterium]